MSTAITNHGAPTTETVGYVGQRYIDLDSCAIYECKAINTIATVNDDSSHPHNFVTIAYIEKRTNEYIWEKIGGAGGGGSIYDAVFVHEPRTTYTTPLVVYGDYATIKAKADKSLPIFAKYQQLTISDDSGKYYQCNEQDLTWFRSREDELVFGFGVDVIYLYPDNTTEYTYE